MLPSAHLLCLHPSFSTNPSFWSLIISASHGFCDSKYILTSLGSAFLTFAPSFKCFNTEYFQIQMLRRGMWLASLNFLAQAVHCRLMASMYISFFWVWNGPSPVVREQESHSTKHQQVLWAEQALNVYVSNKENGLLEPHGARFKSQMYYLLAMWHWSLA